MDSLFMTYVWLIISYCLVACRVDQSHFPGQSFSSSGGQMAALATRSLNRNCVAYDASTIVCMHAEQTPGQITNFPAAKWSRTHFSLKIKLHTTVRGSHRLLFMVSITGYWIAVSGMNEILNYFFGTRRLKFDVCIFLFRVTKCRLEINI